MKQEKSNIDHLISYYDIEFFKDMGKYLPSIIMPAIMGFITIPIITRLFPAKIYGNYVLVLGVITILSTIGGWATPSIIRFYPIYNKKLKLDEFYSTVIILIFISLSIISGFYFCFLFLYKKRFSSSFIHLMYIGLLVFIFTSFFSFLMQFLRAKRKVSYYTYFSLWKSITTIGFGIILVIIFHHGIDGLLWGSIFSIGLILPLLWKNGIKKISIKPNCISIPLTLDIAKYSIPMVIGDLSIWILSLSDRYVLEFYRDSQEVGIYSASYGISEKSIMIIITLFLMASAPIGVNIWEKKGVKASQEFVSAVTRYYLIFCIPAITGLSVLAKPVMKILVAPEYYEGYKIIPFIVVSVFFYGLVYRFSTGLVYHKKTYPAALCNIASGILNLLLNILLVPKYGYVAAAISTLFSYAFLLGIMIFVSRRYFVWKFPFYTLAKVSIASVVMGIVVFIISNSLTTSVLMNLVLGIFIGAMSYTAMLFILREISEQETQTLLKIKQNIFKKLRW